MRAAERLASRVKVWEQYQRLDGVFLPACARVMFLERLQARVACRSTKRLRADVSREVQQARSFINDIDGVNGGKR